MVQDCQNFLKVIKEIKLYLVKFYKDETIKAKEYLFDSAIKGANCQLVIIITYYEGIFLANDSI